MPIQQMLLGAGGGINYAVGQVVFDGDNLNQSWTVPDNVYSISVVCVGRGEPNTDTTSGDGGGLAWASNIQVTPGATLTYTTRAAHDKNSPPSGDSILSGPASGSQAAWSVTGPSSVNGTQSTSYFTGTPGASRGGNRGGNGGVAVTQGFFSITTMPGGGGAAGYSGQGGDSNTSSYNNNAAGGGACCGYQASANNPFSGNPGRSGGGGGVGLLGQGTTGDWTDSQWVSQNVGWGGPGGSGGDKAPNASQTSSGQLAHGGEYGGGAGAGPSSLGSAADHEGAGGGIRIIWPGHERLYPSTRTADE